MTDSVLTKVQALNLLEKLSTDDNFRAGYEKSPGNALQAAGVPSDVVKNLPKENLAPHKLNTKEAFAAALQQVREEVSGVYLCLVVPTVRLNAGTNDIKSSVESTSFSAP